MPESSSEPGLGAAIQANSTCIPPQNLKVIFVLDPVRTYFLLSSSSCPASKTSPCKAVLMRNMCHNKCVCICWMT